MILFNFFVLVKTSETKPPCSYVKYEAIKVSNEKSGKKWKFVSEVADDDYSEKPTINLILMSKMRSQEQVYAMSVLSLVAEIGGIVGLFLGLSLLDIALLTEKIVMKFKQLSNDELGKFK